MRTAEEIRPNHLDQTALALISQPVPHSHDQGKIRVFDVGCGQGVGKGPRVRTQPDAI